ncbi:TPA: hypothetical protein ACQ39K_004440 [Yersinia enterocolitica]
MNNTELEILSARIVAVEVALAYSLANISAKFSDTKPAVIEALLNDAKNNKQKNEATSKAFEQLAGLIAAFKVQ